MFNMGIHGIHVDRFPGVWEYMAWEYCRERKKPKITKFLRVKMAVVVLNNRS